MHSFARMEEGDGLLAWIGRKNIAIYFTPLRELRRPQAKGGRSLVMNRVSYMTILVRAGTQMEKNNEYDPVHSVPCLYQIRSWRRFFESTRPITPCLEAARDKGTIPRGNSIAR